MDVIKKFLNGNWQNKAKDCLNSPNKLSDLLNNVTKHLHNKGLDSVKKELLLMYNYLKDIISGKYKDYDTMKLAIIVAALIYVVSPLDIIPDFVPGGFVDDGAVLLWVYKEAQSELDKYSKQR